MTNLRRVFARKAIATERKTKNEVRQNARDERKRIERTVGNNAQENAMEKGSMHHFGDETLQI